MIHMSRKTAVTSFLVICAVALAATPAIAQGVAFQASSLPLQARGEGLTETIGAVVLQATASGTIPSGSSITIVYSGSIANSTGFTGTSGLSCVITGVAGCTGLASSATGSQLTVQFSSTIAFSLGNYIEVSQVRMNVNGLGTGTTTVTATLSGTSALPVSNPITFTQSTVGVSSIVNPSVKGSIQTTAPAIQTCSVPGGGSTFSVTVAESYPAAFTSLSDEIAFSSLTAPVNGSLISVVISNVPSGLAVMSTGQTSPSTSTVATSLVSSTAAYQASTGSALTFTFAVVESTAVAIFAAVSLFGGVAGAG